MTPTRPLADFLPLVMPYARACPHPLALQALRLAAIDWCERTRCWRHITDVEIIDATTDGAEAIVAPGYATIHEIETATWNDQPLIPIQFSSVDRPLIRVAEPPGNRTEGPPRWITQSSDNTVTVVPLAAGTLAITLFLKPRSGTEYGGDPLNPLHDALNMVPEHIFAGSAEHIANGALARLLAVPDESFTDLQRALYHAARFDEAATMKFGHELKGQHRARVRSNPHWL